MVPYHCSPLKEIRTITQTGQEPGSRSCYRGHGRELLASLLLKVSSASILVELRITNPGIAPPIMGRNLPHQKLIKIMILSVENFLLNAQVCNLTWPGSLSQ